MGKGLIVFHAPEEPIDGEGIEDLEDRGIRFTHNTRSKITNLAGSTMPKVMPIADTMGEAGHGRMVARLIDVVSERRKTFEELSKSEKRDLLEQWYLPHQARQSAKDILEKLRQELVDGKVDTADFEKKIVELGGRFRGEEWLKANFGYQADPDPDRLWPEQYRHLADRHYLKGAVASVLISDRDKKKYPNGSFLPVQVDSPFDEEDVYGAAYLVQVLDRQKPTVDTVATTELVQYLTAARRRRRIEEQDRWERQIDQTFKDFEFEWFGDMADRMKRDQEDRAAARKRG